MPSLSLYTNLVQGAVEGGQSLGQIAVSYHKVAYQVYIFGERALPTCNRRVSVIERTQRMSGETPFGLRGIVGRAILACGGIYIVLFWFAGQCRPCYFGCDGMSFMSFWFVGEC